MQDNPTVTVAMITMNEEKAVGKVISDIRHFMPGAEILIVDSSMDRTPEIASSLGVRTIRQFPPRGYGPAMETALRSAVGEVVVTLDCDDTYPADQIPVMAHSILAAGWDLVDGSRLKGKPWSMPWLNYLANTGFAVLASILFGKWITDLHSGMRAYRKSMIDGMVIQARGAALPVELLLKPLKLGFKVKFHFIEYKTRIGTTTMRPLNSAWWTLKRIFLTRFRG